MKTFEYGRSCKIIQWGCEFDSILELRYAISLHPDYEWLRSPVSIFFDPVTRHLVRFPRKNIRRYTPDFLIRHKQTFQAFWVEVKPRDFSDQQQLDIYKDLASRYIRQKNYDWKFKVAFDDEIVLNLDQIVQFNECCSLINKSSPKFPFEKHYNQNASNYPQLFSAVPDNKRIQFVMFGKKVL